MIRTPTKRQQFEATDGPVSNPFIGFTSYQRFRPDPLFADVRTWLPGEHTAAFKIPLPGDIPAGGYEIGLSVSGENTPVVSWETKGETDGVFLKTGRIEIL